MGFDTLIRDVQQTKDQLGPSDTESLVFKKFDANIVILRPVIKIERVNIGNAFTVGHPVNGIIGTANGINGSQITIGTGGLGTTTLSRVLSSRNEFTDMLRDTEFIDTTTSTATVNTTDFKVTF